MGIEFLISIIAGLASLAAGGIASTAIIRKVLRRFPGQRKKPEKPYSERLAELTASLTKSSREVDLVLAELAQVAGNREVAVQRLEADLAALGNREKELKEKIDALESTPLPVAEHFAKLIEAGEKRSTMRDYALFGAGVVVTTLIAIIIQVVAG